MSEPVLYCWMLRTENGPAPVLNGADLSARFAFADFARATEARDDVLALAERTGHAFDLYILTAATPIMSIDPAEWQHDDPHVPLDPPSQEAPP